MFSFSRSLARLLPGSSRRRDAPDAELPARMAELLPDGERPLGAVPIVEDGSRWAVAGPHRLVLLGPDGVEDVLGWDEVSRGSWDQDARVFTLGLLRRDPAARPAGEEELLLTIPKSLRYIEEDGSNRAHEVAEEPFARALRHGVDGAIVHHVSGILPSGRRATASVRRDRDGALYTVTDPDSSEVGTEEDRTVLAGLVRRVSDGVGLPTR